MSSPTSPPPANPVLSAYESFVSTTPLVTRYILTSNVISFFLSFFTDPSFALSNIPYYTLFKFELYRMVTSPLICTSLLNLIFTFFGFMNHGKLLEFSIGSSSFAALVFTLGAVTNLAFLLLSLALYFMSGGNMSYLHGGSSGIWTVLLALIAIECCKAPRDSKRKLFVIEMPTIYYPLGILALFTLFGGVNLSYFLSVGVGYAYGYGYLDRLKVSNERCRRWEGNDGCLSNFTSRAGWVYGNAAQGASAWGNTAGGGGGGEEGGGWSPTSFFRGQPTSTDQGSSREGGTVATPPAGGWGAQNSPTAAVSSSKEPSFPTSGGQSLGGSNASSGGLTSRLRGGSSNRGGGDAASAREAMLAAAERRSQKKNGNNDEADQNV